MNNAATSIVIKKITEINHENFGVQLKIINKNKKKSQGEKTEISNL